MEKTGYAAGRLLASGLALLLVAAWKDLSYVSAQQAGGKDPYIACLGIAEPAFKGFFDDPQVAAQDLCRCWVAKAPTTSAPGGDIKPFQECFYSTYLPFCQENPGAYGMRPQAGDSTVFCQCSGQELVRNFKASPAEVLAIERKCSALANNVRASTNGAIPTPPTPTPPLTPAAPTLSEKQEKDEGPSPDANPSPTPSAAANTTAGGQKDGESDAGPKSEAPTAETTEAPADSTAQSKAASSSASATSAGLSVLAAVAIGIGTLIALASCGCILLISWRRKREAQRQAHSRKGGGGSGDYHTLATPVPAVIVKSEDRDSDGQSVYRGRRVQVLQAVSREGSGSSQRSTGSGGVWARGSSASSSIYNPSELSSAYADTHRLSGLPAAKGASSSSGGPSVARGTSGAPSSSDASAGIPRMGSGASSSASVRASDGTEDEKLIPGTELTAAMLRTIGREISREKAGLGDRPSEMPILPSSCPNVTSEPAGRPTEATERPTDMTERPTDMTERPTNMTDDRHSSSVSRHESTVWI